jgi:hypothetical protein
MYLQKVIRRKTFLKNYFFGDGLKVNDENSTDPNLDPDPDPDPPEA